MEEYYFNKLNKQQRIAYNEMKAGLKEINSSFYVTRIEKTQLSQVYEYLLMDHPELFYCVEGKYRYFEDSNYVEMTPVYLFKKDKIIEHQKSINVRIERICKGCKEVDSTLKVKYLHDFICENVKYDKLKKPHSHNVIGPLTTSVGVCEGIAKSFKILCDKLNIYCICVVSDNNPIKKIKYRHMWNIVKLDNKYYHIDCTFDGSLSKNCLRYDYYLIDDKSIFKDHEPIINDTYCCNDLSKQYYRTNKLAFNNTDDTSKLVKKMMRKNKSFAINYIGGGLNKDLLKNIIFNCEQQLKEKDKKGLYQINYTQGIIECNITDNKEFEIIEQQPNESELIEEKVES